MNRKRMTEEKERVDCENLLITIGRVILLLLFLAYVVLCVYMTMIDRRSVWLPKIELPLVLLSAAASMVIRVYFTLFSNTH